MNTNCCWSLVKLPKDHSMPYDGYPGEPVKEMLTDQSLEFGKVICNFKNIFIYIYLANVR